MAVPSSPSENKRKMEVSESAQKEETGQMTKQQQKRSKDPGVRVVGGRIYDSQNGKTCHQCRQKTMDFTARCKNMKQGKQCTIMFCHKCLLNRYGEKAEEMAVTDDWQCPKCRDMCNCSVCMKKKGLKPTGILVHAAKATGYSSVSELLHVKGSDVCQEMIAKCKTTAPKKSEASTKDDQVKVSKKRGKENAFDGACGTKVSKKRGKENAFDGACGTNSNSKDSDSILDEEAEKSKGEKLKKQVGGPPAKAAVTRPQTDNADAVLRRSPRKISPPSELTKEEAKDDQKAAELRRIPRKSNAPQELTKQEEKMDGDNAKAPSVAVVEEAKQAKKPKGLAEGKAKKSNKVDGDKGIISDDVMQIALPQGTLLINVAGIDLVPEDVGYALQFLEFCSTFGEVLDIKKGQSECVLRDVMCGRRRRGKCSSAVQFFNQLLTFMFKDREEEEEQEEESSDPSPGDSEATWIHSLKRCLSESQLELEDLPENWLNKGVAGYEMLESSQKLRLLTFLCDEALSVPEIRKWMEDQNAKQVEKGKEVTENANAAKEKAKMVKRRMQEELVKALIERNGVPLSVAEHDAIFLEIKAEADKAQDEMMQAMGLVSRKRKVSDAVRTEPIIIDVNGSAFWKLKGLADTTVLLQDMGALEQVSANDKWFSFDDEGVKIVEKFISSVRLKTYRRNKLADQTVKTSSSEIEPDPVSNE